jgi:hypothetical protein
MAENPPHHRGHGRTTRRMRWEVKLTVKLPIGNKKPAFKKPPASALGY